MATITHTSQPATSSSALKQWITRHPVLAYIILAYVVCWTIFLVPLFSQEGIGLLPYDIPFLPFVLLASVFGLAGSALTVTAVVDGRAGVRALASRWVRWRVGVHWYLIAFFGPLILTLAGISVVYGLAPIGALSQQGPALIGYVIQVVVAAALVNLWEETGWGGFMFTRLQPRYGALGASLLVAPCMGGIHLPLLFISGAVTTTQLSPGLLLFGILELLVLLAVPFRVLAAWLYNNAKGSLLILGLFHASFDATTGSVLVPLLLPKGVDTTVELLVSLAVAAVLLALFTRRRLAYQPISDLQPVPPAK
ncbi:MAG TPA: CPBP family glutamic-type intramembrane protease [Ktedonobacterales bacterium]|nr:CPBP family glutamic-type intramembrane protease [Ktedonobacterales bacterium]